MVYITYKMGNLDLLDIHAHALWPATQGIYIRQIPFAHVITYNLTTFCILNLNNSVDKCSNPIKFLPHMQHFIGQLTENYYLK